MKVPESRYSVARYVLLVLMIFQALSGLVGGVPLVFDPTGSVLRMPLDLLENTPFGSYLILGLIC